MKIVGHQLRVAPDIWPRHALRPQTRRDEILVQDCDLACRARPQSVAATLVLWDTV